MTTRISTRCCLLVAALAAAGFAPLPARAQMATPAPSQPEPAAGKKPAPRPPIAVEKKTAEGDATVLSPFEVQAEKDDGFVAVNAGTATKLGLDMKDMAAPYSVMTGEFIKAMGITDLQQAALWSTSGAPVIDGQGADLFGGNSTASLSSMYFNRGSLLNSGQQRNFFLTAGLSDTYNVERIDFGRGPNAVLFNVGANDALGGGISTQGKRPRLDRDADTISLTTGSWDYYRGTLDVNRVLSRRVAIRANALLQSRNGWQQQEFEDRKGLTLSGLFRLAPRTELRVEMVSDRTDRSRVPVPYTDNVSGWDGATVFNGRLSNAMVSGSATPGAVYGLTYNGEPQGVWREGSNRFVLDPASGVVMNWIHTGYTRVADETPRTPAYIDGVPWTRNGNSELLALGIRGSSGTNRTPNNNSNGGGQPAFTDMLNLPGGLYDRVLANSRFKIPGRRYSNMPDAPLFVQSTQDGNFGFTHQFSDNLFLDVQGDANTVKERSVASHLNFRLFYLDLNRNLPNGQPNPNFLDGFTESNLTTNFRRLENAGLRAYLGYIANLGKWGHYTFNLSGGYNGRDVRYRQTGLSMANSADPREWHAFGLLIRERYYENAAAHPFLDVTANSVFNVTPVNGGNDGYTTAIAPIAPKWVLTQWGDRRERTKNGIFAFAARFFDNKLVISPGVRMDQQTTYMRLSPTSWAFLPNDPSWDGVTLDGRYWRPDAPADWKTLSYTPKNADGTPRSKVPIPAFGNRPTINGVNDVNPANPLYANDRFRNDYNNPQQTKRVMSKSAGLTYHAFHWASLKLSYGDSYKPADTGRMTLVGDDAKPETGKAYEAGVTLSLFHERLILTPRIYFNRKENLLADPPTTGPINSLMGTRAWNDSSPEGRNPFGYANVIGQDYYANRNKGYEVELVGRITRGWRVSGSLGVAQAKDYDRFHASRAYVLSRKDEMLDVLKAAGGKIDPAQKPMNGSRSVDDAPGLAIADPAVTDQMITNAGNQPSLRTNAINNYNNIWTQYDNILLLKDTIGLKNMSAKLVTDYTVQTGTLKGLRFGLSAYFVDQDTAGYRSGDTVANPNYNAAAPVTSTNRPWMDDPNVDINTPVFVKRPFEVRGIFGYTTRLHSRWRTLNNRELDLQLNVINLLNGHDVYYAGDGLALRPPNGDVTAPNRVSVPSRIGWYQRPMSFEFTMTLRL